MECICTKIPQALQLFLLGNCFWLGYFTGLKILCKVNCNHIQPTIHWPKIMLAIFSGNVIGVGIVYGVHYLLQANLFALFIKMKS
jgi:hypothetical protein